MAQGKFITFEGGEGSGKSTQVKVLAERLAAQGIDVLVTREPGGSPFAERLRRILLDPAVEPHSALAEALLFYAARADHLDKVIRPAIAAGRWVLCDRFSDSTLVYQFIVGGVPREAFDALETIVVASDRPDTTVLLDLPADVGLSRAIRRRVAEALTANGPQSPADGSPSRERNPDALLAPADSYERRDLAYHQRLRDGYLEIARADATRVVIVDAAAEIETVAAAVWTAIEARLLARTR